MQKKTRVLMVDDARDLLDLYRRVISAQPDMECVEALDSTIGLEEALERSQADVAVIDLTGTGRDGFLAIGAAATARPSCRIIAFSGYDDQATREQARRAGAWTLVSKLDAPAKLLEEIRRAGSAPDPTA